MEFRAPGQQQPIYQLNPHQPVVGASADKIYWEGTAFAALGPNYRFRTPVYRTGPVTGGVLHGDLVVVASGDLLLSGRLRAKRHAAATDPRPHLLPPAGRQPTDRRGSAAGNPAHRQPDHRKRVRRVAGQILVDTSLFHQAEENIGTGATVPSHQ